MCQLPRLTNYGMTTMNIFDDVTFKEQRELCSEVKETAEKYQRLFMNEPNINKQTDYSTRMNAQVNFYQTFCKDLSHLFN